MLVNYVHEVELVEPVQPARADKEKSNKQLKRASGPQKQKAALGKGERV